MIAQFLASVTPQAELKWHHQRGLEDFLAAHAGKAFRVSFNEPRRRRTTDQNGYYWRIVVAMIADEIGEYGKEGRDRVHEALKAKYLPVETHGSLVFTPSTINLSTKEFAQYVDNIRMDAASGELLGAPLVIPDPEK